MKYLLSQCLNYLEIISCHLLYYPYILRFYLSKKNKLKKLQVGCGNNLFPDWINADIKLKTDLIIFLQKKLPFKNNYLKLIYCEHVLEHLSYKQGIFFLKEAYRTLKEGGIIRIAMPDLDDLIEGYQTNWKKFDWINWPEYSFVKTKAEMLNIAFRWWEHQYLYNKEELARAFKEAGFKEIYFAKNSQSNVKDLINLETRVDSKLIAEALKI